MKMSICKCPKCKTRLFLTNSARYWCTICQSEMPAEDVRGSLKDTKRTDMLVETIIERLTT